ncbi:hypothetical protein T492DRAFT_849704 [Pavlovales sp. CCMP2436]|nr:hypothetical protein T492DRAFT_849704 [Pavlovales sp. CCMP2436]
MSGWGMLIALLVVCVIGLSIWAAILDARTAPPATKADKVEQIHSDLRPFKTSTEFVRPKKFAHETRLIIIDLFYTLGFHATVCFFFLKLISHFRVGGIWRVFKNYASLSSFKYGIYDEQRLSRCI